MLLIFKDNLGLNRFQKPIDCCKIISNIEPFKYFDNVMKRFEAILGIYFINHFYVSVLRNINKTKLSGHGIITVYLSKI